MEELFKLDETISEYDCQPEIKTGEDTERKINQISNNLHLISGLFFLYDYLVLIIEIITGEYLLLKLYLKSIEIMKMYYLEGNETKQKGR